MRNVLLRHAIPLVRTHGFTRQALSIAALSLPTPHCEPLSETAVSALFGPGDEARKTLIRAWLGEGIDRMGQCDGAEGGEKTQSIIPIQDALKNRLKWNEPVLNHLPEVRASDHLIEDLARSGVIGICIIIGPSNNSAI